MVGVVVDGKAREVLFIWEFHEGDISRRIDKKCFLNRIDDLKESSLYKLTPISIASFYIKDQLGKSQKFIKVESFNSVFNEKIIAGNFLSDAGSVYKFLNSGEVVLNGASYAYRLIMDRVEFDSDVLVIDSSPRQLMKIRWHSGMLFLHKYIGSSNEFEEKPIVLFPLSFNTDTQQHNWSTSSSSGNILRRKTTTTQHETLDKNAEVTELEGQRVIVRCNNVKSEGAKLEGAQLVQVEGVNNTQLYAVQEVHQYTQNSQSSSSLIGITNSSASNCNITQANVTTLGDLTMEGCDIKGRC